MSAFTMPLKEAIKFLGGEAKIVDGVMVVTGDIGLSHYPIFDDAYRPLLNGKIVRHYWNQEIGVETPDLFKFNLETDMGELMPYFNQLYLSEKLALDPLNTVDIRTLATGTASQESSTVNDRTSTQDTATTTAANTDGFVSAKSRAVSSQTPQSMLSGNNDYATSGQDSSGGTTSTGSSAEDATAIVESESNDKTDSTGSASTADESRTTGFQGSQSDLLMRYRETFMNIDKSVIESLSDNFMLITNSGSTYSDRYTFERYGY